MRKPYKPVLLKPHAFNCYAILNAKRGTWSTPWAFLDHVDYRDSIGRLRKSGGSRWWYVRCNCTHCPAAVLVHETSILNSLPRGKEGMRIALPTRGDAGG